MFIQLNGYELCLNEGDIEDFAVLIATKSHTVDEIAAWFKKKTKQ